MQIIGIKRDWREHLIKAPGRERRRDLPLRRGRRRLRRRGRLRVSRRRRQNCGENAAGDPWDEFILHDQRLCSPAAQRAVMRANTFGGRFCCRFNLRQDEVKMGGQSVKISRFQARRGPGAGRVVPPFVGDAS